MGSSDASVIRFCRDLGFSGFQEFKLALAGDLALSPVELGTQPVPERPAEILDYVVRHAHQAIEATCQLVHLDAVERAAELIAAAPRTDLYGAGASGVTAEDFAYKFLRLGLNAQAYRDPHLAAMAAVSLQPGMVAVGISRSGTTIDTVKALEAARRSGAAVVAITHRTRGGIAQAADLVLATSIAESPLAGGSVSAKMGQLLVLDLLFTLIALNHPRAATSIARTAAVVADRSLPLSAPSRFSENRRPFRLSSAAVKKLFH